MISKWLEEKMECYDSKVINRGAADHGLPTSYIEVLRRHKDNGNREPISVRISFLDKHWHREDA